MTTADVKVTPGTGANVATYSISEDAETKQIQRVGLNDVGGAILSDSTGIKISTSQLSTLGQTTMSASQPVAIASDQTYGNSTGSAVPAKAMYGGANAITALPTAATAGNLEGISADKFGRQIMLPVTVRDLVGTQAATLSASTSETTIITAGGAGIFNDLMCLVVSNTSASTNTRVDIRDATGGTIIASLQSVGGAPPVGIPYMGTPIPQTTAANNWTAQCATSTTDVRVFAVYAKNK